MTVQTLFAALAGGGCHLEFIFHICGFADAYATDTNVAAKVAASTTRLREMFGGDAINAVTYLADTVKIHGGVMLRPGRQRMRMHETKGLEGGDFDISLKRQIPGWIYPHRGKSLQGLDGVQIIPDAGFDHSIAQCYLSRNFLSTHGDAPDATRLYVKNDKGDKLQALIDALGFNEAVILWIGNEAVAVSAYAAADDPGELQLTIEARGCYGSKAQSFYMDDSDGPGIWVASAPLGGASTQRPCKLWAFLINDDDDSIQGTGLILRHGIVADGDIVSKGGITRIGCRGPVAAVKTNIRNAPLEEQIKGYTFSRCYQDDIHDQSPHLTIWWSDYSFPEARKDLWLLPAPIAAVHGTSVHYDTWEEVKQAVNDEFEAMVAAGIGATTANGSTGTDHIFRIIEPWGLTCMDDPGRPDQCSCTGILAWLGNLGQPRRRDSDRIQDMFDNYDTELFTHRSSTNKEHDDSVLRRYIPYFNPVWSGTPVRPVGQNRKLIADGCSKLPDKTARARYILDYGWRDDTGPDPNFGPGELLWSWPIPSDPTHGAVIWLGDDVDFTQFSPDDIITFGKPDRTFGDRPGFLKGKLDSADPPYDDTNNLLDMNTDYYFQVQTASIKALRTADQENGPIEVGAPLFYIPEYHDKDNDDGSGDPWTVSFQMNVHATNTSQHAAVKLIRALLGDTVTGVHVPKRYQADFIPDMYEFGTKVGTSGRSPHEATFDWDQISDELFAAAPISDMYFQLPLNNNISIWDLILNLLLTHGLHMTYPFKESVKQHVIQARPIGEPNQSIATNNGRRIDAEKVKWLDAPSEAHSGTWRPTSLKLSAHYNSYKEKFLFNLYHRGQQGYQTMAQGDALAIKDYLTHIRNAHRIKNDLSRKLEISEFYNSMLGSLSLTLPEIEVKMGINAALKIAVGEECEVTHPACFNPYDGSYGVTDLPGLCVELMTNYSGKAPSCTARIRVGQGDAGVYGWAPSLYIPAARITKDDATTASVVLTAAEDNIFTSSNASERKDIGWFDCYYFNFSDNIYEAKDCSCSDYSCILQELDAAVPDKYAVVVSDVSPSARTLTLTGGFGALDDTKDYVLYYNAYDQAALQDCQKKFVFFADAADEIEDSDAVKYAGSKWR